ncbi:cytochrome b/b6 domain-containing protein [Antarcticimicrobium luteum]|uniref:Cytochrome n=1 Tax=Antarcticimicrobium luteum TaxID=2547397 RepID=A0A4R5VDI7_9RHOB|nr:cytochrome b/b6 domain-containing protein [Antarcticimicrobium luteum]TDK49825.1 cytochrome [Antarcticimicrobium luteum]
MPLANTDRSYGAVSKTFHWLTALLILTALPLGWIASTLAHAATDPASGATDADVARAGLLFSLHKTVGVAVFFVALARILWAMTQAKPGLLNAENRPEATAAELAHWLLYGALVLVPLSGWVHHAATTGFAPILWPFGQSLPFVPKSPALAEISGGLHFIAMLVLVAALLAHVAGALKHFVIDRDFTLQRMLPGFGAGPQPGKARHSALPPVLAALVWIGALGLGGAAGLLSPAAQAPRGPALERLASDWQVRDGALEITVQQMGKPVSGHFGDWTAAITFEPRDTPGPAGSVEVQISIPSLALGSVTSQAMGADFFDAERFPRAVFRGEIVRTETGYAARGPLSLRGVEVAVALPFALEIDGDTAQMEGALSLDRLAFGIGQGMAEEASLGHGVAVSVTLIATRSPAPST